jgi:hypothetical protein
LLMPTFADLHLSALANLHLVYTETWWTIRPAVHNSTISIFVPGIFTKMPSKFRMIQLYASKQATIESIIPQEWIPTAKAFYVRALPRAAKMRRHRRGASPTPRSGSPVRSKKLTKRPKHMSQMNLFSLDNASPLAPSPDQPDDTSGDAVVAEMEKWFALPSSTVAPFCVDGLVDEFALVSSLKDSFPLHHTVFRQCASHSPHEGNSENVFSMA